MKGIVFTEFLDMVEGKFGYEAVHHILENSELPSGGIYTSVGTYHHSEIVSLLMNLSDYSKLNPQDLLKAFGEYLFDSFLRVYPQFFEVHETSFGFLHSIDNHIHVEVQKLYPEASLPKFETEVDNEGRMIMIYKSERKMAALAEGLIGKSIQHFNENHTVKKEKLTDDGSMVKFIISPA